MSENTNTFTLDEVLAWIDRNMFFGSPAAARTAMEDAVSRPRTQATYEHAYRQLDLKGTVTCKNTSPLGLTFIEMNGAGLVEATLLDDGVTIEVTRP
jgi:hypothetical protein